MDIVDFCGEGCPLSLYHVCQGGYVLFNDIDFYGAEQNICRYCVDDIWG